MFVLCDTAALLCRAGARMGRGGADGGGELVLGAEAGGCEGETGGAQAGAVAANTELR